MHELFNDLPEALENNENFPLRISYRTTNSAPVLPNIDTSGKSNVDKVLKEESITHPCLTHIESDVTEVHWHDNGEVDYLKLKDGREHRSDLYVDCTGFKRLLSRDPKKDMVDLSDRLFTNTAIAGPIQYQLSLIHI